MNNFKEEEKIILELSNEEALVFFDWLVRFNENEDMTTIEDQAEERVLFDLESTLEKSLSKVLSSNYNEILAIAREKVRDEE